MSNFDDKNYPTPQNQVRGRTDTLTEDEVQKLAERFCATVVRMSSGEEDLAVGWGEIGKQLSALDIDTYGALIITLAGRVAVLELEKLGREAEPLPMPGMYL